MPTPGWLRREDLPVDASNRRYIDPPNLDQILDQFANWRGDVNAGGHKLLNFGYAPPGNVELGFGTPGNHASYIDFIGDDTYTDYGLRIIRNDDGPDASSEILHRGAGELRFTTQESAPISFYVGATEALRVTETGIRFPDGSVQGSAGVPTTRQILTGYGLTGGGDLSADRTLSVLDNTSLQKLLAAVNGLQTATPAARRMFNFIAGSNVVITGADNATDDRVDLTIASTGGGGGSVGGDLPLMVNGDVIGYAGSSGGTAHTGDAVRVGLGDNPPDSTFEYGLLTGTTYAVNQEGSGAIGVMLLAPPPT